MNCGIGGEELSSTSFLWILLQRHHFKCMLNDIGVAKVHELWDWR